MKRSYELTFIVRIDPSDEVMNETIQQVKAWVEENGNGTINAMDAWGRRRLAYEVNGQREGYYMLFYADLDPEHIPELERNLKLSNTVLRYLLVRGDDTKPSEPKATKAAQATEAQTDEASATEEESEEDNTEADQPDEEDETAS